MEKISQLELDVNNTLELYYYFNNLISEHQINQWIDMYGDDLKTKSVDFGQPLGVFLLFEYQKLKLTPSELLRLSTNFINRANEFLIYIASHDNLEDFDSSLFIQYIDLLKLNPIDFNLLERSFHIYIEYCFKYKEFDNRIGVFKRWIIE